MSTTLVKRKIAALRKKSQLRQDLEDILATDQGQRFFKHLLRECHVTRPIFHENDNRLRESEGRRRFAMSLLLLVAGEDPQQLITKIEQEHNNE